MSNNAISALVAIFAVGVVVGIPVVLVIRSLGEWAPVFWVGLGLAFLFGVMRQVNA